MISCPHDVIGYKHEPGQYKPFHLEEELGLANCGHGEKDALAALEPVHDFEIGKPKLISIFSGVSEKMKEYRNLQRYPLG